MSLGILHTFKWPDVLDVLVISFIVHRLFLLFRGTTAFQIMLGFLFVWLFQAIAQAAGLVLTSWFFQGVGAVAVLVIVIVFRNEIREVLIQTNPARFFLGRPYTTRSFGVTAMAKTVFQLADTRTGALIVLQNRDNLRGHLREGLALDGKFSPQIIESIFSKQSPVHDGAIVIRGNRITRVGTFLPLTQTEGLPQHFGTRHRAAIGLSEVSDAVVVAVSEERGEVAVVHKGKVHPMADPHQLRRTFRRLLLGVAHEARPRSRGRELLAQSAGLVLSFLLVSTFWGIYSGKQLSLINVTAPVDFRNIPENLELKKTSHRRVEVQITGKRRLVSALKPEQVAAFLDLKEMGNGVHHLLLNPDNVELPLGLEVMRVTPATIRLEMEQRVEKEVAVKPKIVGSPPTGYQIEKVSVYPEAVRVTGALSILRNVASVFTEPIDIGGIDPQERAKALEVPLMLSPASLRLLPGQSKRIQVNLLLQPRTTSNHVRGTIAHYHVVGAGETLYGISRRYGLTVDDLRRLNGLNPGAVIYPDQKLMLRPEGSN